MRSIPRPDNRACYPATWWMAAKPEEYAHLRQLLAPLAMPLYMISRQPRRARCAAPGLCRSRPTCRPPASCNTRSKILAGTPDRARQPLVPGKPHGELCAERLDWLEARLGESDRPTAPLHAPSPPFEDCGIAAFDNSRLSQRRHAAGRAGAPSCQRRPRDVRPCPSPHPDAMGPALWPRSRPATAHQATLDLHDGATLSMMMEPAPASRCICGAPAPA